MITPYGIAVKRHQGSCGSRSHILDTGVATFVYVVRSYMFNVHKFYVTTVQSRVVTVNKKLDVRELQ